MDFNLCFISCTYKAVIASSSSAWITFGTSWISVHFLVEPWRNDRVGTAITSEHTLPPGISPTKNVPRSSCNIDNATQSKFFYSHSICLFALCKQRTVWILRQGIKELVVRQFARLNFAESILFFVLWYNTPKKKTLCWRKWLFFPAAPEFRPAREQQKITSGSKFTSLNVICQNHSRLNDKQDHDHDHDHRAKPRSWILCSFRSEARMSWTFCRPLAKEIYHRCCQFLLLNARPVATVKLLCHCWIITKVHAIFDLCFHSNIYHLVGVCKVKPPKSQEHF